MKPDGDKHSAFSVPNNRPGAEALVDRVVEVLHQLLIPKVVIGMESTSVYGDNLLYFLRETGKFSGFEKKLHVLNPKQVRKFKEAYPELPKNDFVDAFVIADHLRFGRISKEVYAGDYRHEALKVMTRARHQTVQSLTREKQRFLNQLFLKFSGFTQEKIFSDSFGATAVAVIEAFESLDDLAYMDADELAAFIQKHGRGKFEDVDGTVSDLQKGAKNSYRPPTVIADSVNQILAISMSAIRLLQKQIKEYDKAIEQRLSAIPNTLTSVKGIGLVYAAGIIAEIGDVNRFPSQASLAKYAGLTWTTTSVRRICGGGYPPDSNRQSPPALLSLRSRQFSEKMRPGVSALLQPQIPRGFEASAQTRTRAYCPQVGQVGIRPAENQPPLYPAGGVIPAET